MLSPWSVPEMYHETIRAFSLAERFRVPVIVLGDEGVGHLRELVQVPATTSVYERDRSLGGTPFGECDVPPMPVFGDGERLLVTGSTHDARGYRRTADGEVQAALVERLASKISDHRHEIVRSETLCCGEDDLDVLFVAYGFTARSAHRAVQLLRGSGVRAGLLRLRTLWPLDEGALRANASKARRVVVPEMNRGQLLREVQRLAPDARGYHKTNGEVIVPSEIVAAAREAL